MSDERIDIEIQDKVSPGISAKILAIAKASRDADSAVSKLKASLASINVGALQQLQQVTQNASNALNQNALANQRLASELQRTAAASANAQAAQTRANTAQTQGASAAQRLAESTARAATAQQQTANAAQRLATEQARTAAATAQAQAAADRAALAALRLQQAQDRVANSANGAGRGIMNFVRSAAALVGVGLSAHAILQAADAYTTLQNKLKNVTETEQGLATVTNEVFNIANRTRAPVQETAQAFTRFDMAMKGLGASQEESLRLTETVNKSLIVSGATSSEAASGLLQLSQAFNKGKLDGDEFRSVMELMPLAADAIAKQMKVTRGELLRLAPEGKITAEIMRKAFAGAADEIDRKFAKTMPTLSQAMTVLKNSGTQFFGELNKSLGITAGMSAAILFLADNMKALALGLAIIGAALLVAFGPALVGMLAAATSAVWAFTVAIATNPIGALVVGITAAVVGIALFGDQIKVSADGLVTLKDTALAVWSFVKDGFGAVASFIKDAWNAAIDFISSKTNGFGEKFRDIGGAVMEFGKNAINGYIGLWVGAYNAITKGWSLFPAAMKDIFAMALNFVVDIAGKIANAALEGINKITTLANAGAEKLGIGKIFEGDLSVSLDKYKMEVTGAAADLAGTVKGAFADAFNTDFVGNAVGAIEKRAADISKARRAAEAAQAANNGGLRGEGTAGKITDPKALKAAENRARALSHVNAELDKELRGLNVLKPEREIQSKLDQVEINLASKKIKLTDQERDSLRGKIKAIEDNKAVQQAFDQIYENAIAPARDYNAQLTAANKLLAMGAITQEQYGRAVVQSAEAYKGAIDPLYSINKELSQQFEILSKIGPQQEIAQQMQQYQNDLLQKGIVLNEQERASLQSKLQALQEQKAVSQELNKIYSETQGKQLSLQQQVTALNQAYASGLINLDNYSNRLVKIGVDMSNLKLQMGDGSFNDVMISSLGSIVSQYEGVMSGLSGAFGNFFQSFTDGFANSIGRAIVYSENLQDALSGVAKEVLSSLISALIKLGIQYVINAALGQAVGAAALTAATAGSVAAAAVTATAWAPAAALVSLASWGANSVPAMAGITATAALSEGLALASIAGFESGGFTGNVGTSEIAGVVHGQEFVVNAAATARNRDTLEAMNRGASGVAANSSNVGSNGGGGVSVKIENYGTSKDFEVQQISETDIRIIARDEARSAVRKETPAVIASELSNANSSVSKSLTQHTQTQRRR